LSSLRKQGPITTNVIFADGVCHSALSVDRAVWVPAFAGTTRWGDFRPSRRQSLPVVNA
jgi:hypothetical protein